MRRKVAPCSMELKQTEEDNLTLFFLTLILQVFYCQETTFLSVLHIFPLLFVFYVLKYYVLQTVSQLSLLDKMEWSMFLGGDLYWMLMLQMILKKRTDFY